MLSQDAKVFKEGMKQLDELADYVESLYSQSTSKGSVLLSELASTSNPLEALYDKEVTPLVHAMSAAHAYVNVFVFICRGAQVSFFRREEGVRDRLRISLLMLSEFRRIS